MKCGFLMIVALLLTPNVTHASHCKALTQTLAEYKKASQQADKAEKSGRTQAACKLRKKTVGLADKMLRMKTDCFHGGKKQFEFLATSARALEDMACNMNGSDEEFFEDLF